MVLVSPTNKRTEGRAPVWGSEFTSKRRRTTLVTLVNDSEYSRSTDAKSIMSLSCIYFVSPSERRGRRSELVLSSTPPDQLLVLVLPPRHHRPRCGCCRLLLFRCGCLLPSAVVSLRPGNPRGNGVWPGEVLHGDHQLMRPARFAAPPIVCRK